MKKKNKLATNLIFCGMTIYIITKIDDQTVVKREEKPVSYECLKTSNIAEFQFLTQSDQQ